MDWDIPHAFLGLTKNKSPDELDKIDFQRYKQIYPSILGNDFKGKGFFGFAPVESTTSHWGKVYENNQK